ncbi:MAG: shikimate dehydrogenase [Bacteroidetes bacterium]|nr:MAG: shikimate dehydrogenase [Bacteroidota bacterium]
MRKYGLIGKTLKHSFSKKYFDNKFKEENIIDCSYELYELARIEDIKQLLSDNPDIEGLNITLPYKESVIPFLDELDESVKDTDACNCIKITNGKLIGYNTDKEGFLEAFLSVMIMDYHNMLILGNGGASKAVAAALDELSLEYTIVARNPKHKDDLNWKNLTTEHITDANVIINTTPLGMFPNTEQFPDIPYEAISRVQLAFDLIYNPEKTEFLKRAEAQGAEIENGMYMLELQADKAWEIFND